MAGTGWLAGWLCEGKREGKSVREVKSDSVKRAVALREAGGGRKSVQLLFVRLPRRWLSAGCMDEWVEKG